MDFGASIFFTDYSISPAELKVALEERGFDALWAAEHSHIPASRRTPAPGGGDQAAQGGHRLCVVIQLDTIQTAKQVASIDQVSGGRFLFCIGGGRDRCLHILDA